MQTFDMLLPVTVKKHILFWRKKVWWMIVVLLSVYLFYIGWGCLQYEEDRGNLVVQPGIGIPGLCEVGMTTHDLKKRNRDFKTVGYRDRWWRLWGRWQHGRGRYGVIPSFGAITAVVREGPVSHITFHVQPYQHPHPNLSGLRIDTPFRGMLQGRSISFADGLVDRQEIITEFGVLPECQNPTEYSELFLERRPFSWKGHNGDELLFYFDNGITFLLRSNVVENFLVYSPEIKPMKK